MPPFQANIAQGWARVQGSQNGQCPVSLSGRSQTRGRTCSCIRGAAKHLTHSTPPRRAAPRACREGPAWFHKSTGIFSSLFLHSHSAPPFFFFWSFILSFFFFFSGPHLQLMEVPRLRAKSEMQLPAFTTATATPDLSHVCHLHHSSR